MLTNDSTEKMSEGPVWKAYTITFPGILLLVLIPGTSDFLIYNKIFRSEWTYNLISSDDRISVAVMPLSNKTIQPGISGSWGFKKVW
jgi:hypothetical protein